MFSEEGLSCDVFVSFHNVCHADRQSTLTLTANETETNHSLLLLLLQVGDLMMIKDHIALVGMVGHNALMGPNDNALGPRFPSLSDVYDQKSQV